MELSIRLKGKSLISECNNKVQFLKISNDRNDEQSKLAITNLDECTNQCW